MKCVNEKCEKRNYCEKVHALNDMKINEDIEIVIPNRFFYELNTNNRLIKTGIPTEGFTFGCFKMVKKYENSEVGELYINDNHVDDFDLAELIEMGTRAFREMVESGELKIV